MPEAIRITGELGDLRDPVLLAAFRGWTDPAGVALGVMRYLRREWEARPVAEIPSEHFYDFSVQRPRTRSANGERAIRWPTLRIHAARPPGADRDFLLLFGPEPGLHWRTLTEMISDFMTSVGCSTSVTVGALGGAVPHTRPSPVVLWGAHPELQTAFGLESSYDEYQGPIGFQNALNVHHASLGWKTAFVFALVPHYLQLGANPGATRPVIQALDRAFGTTTSVARLDEWEEALERRVEQIMAHTERPREMADYINRLEAEYDASPPTVPFDGGRDTDSPLSAEDVISDLERFLRDERERGD